MAPADVDWETDAGAEEALIEFAGRACYETFDKPNPRTATNAAYVRHLIEVGHLAVLEHANATMYLRGISRSAAGELMRHRHFSFSQLSQRFVSPGEQDVVIPAEIADDPHLAELFRTAVDESRFYYNTLLAELEAKFEQGSGNQLLRQKQARQAARAVLPNATESKLVVTGNYRSWRHFIAMRATEHADIELRTIAIACLKLLKEQAPAVFSDFEITDLPDGTQMAVSPLVTDY